MSDANASIDDLLRHEEEPPPEPARPAGGVSWWVATVFIAAALAAVAVFGVRLLGYDLPAPLAFAGCLALLMLRRAVRAAAAPPPAAPQVRLPSGEEAGEYNWAAGEDGLNAAVRRWEQHLAKPERTGRAPSTLAQVVDERLRQRHGLTMTSDPDRARALLGDPLWMLLTRPPKRMPPPRDVAAALSHLEKL